MARTDGAGVADFQEVLAGRYAVTSGGLSFAPDDRSAPGAFNPPTIDLSPDGPIDVPLALD